MANKITSMVFDELAKNLRNKALQAVLAQIEENEKNTRALREKHERTNNQRMLDYDDGVLFGLEMAKNEVRAEMEAGGSKVLKNPVSL